MRSVRLSLLVFLAISATAGACVSNSAPPPNLTSDGGVLGSGSGSSSGSSGSGGSSSSGGSSGSGSGSSSGGSSSGSSSGGADAGGDGSVTPTSCTYTVTGGNASNGACAVSIAYGSGKLILGLSVAGSNPAADAAFVFSSELSTTNNFAAGTFTSANVVNSAATSANIGTGAVWSEYFNYETEPDQGTFTLTITSTGTEITDDGGAAWVSPHGSVTVSLPAKSGGATGTLAGTASF